MNQINPDDLVVLELSSFQIEQLAEIQKAPKVVLLTNLTPNHLDRYGTFEKYCAAKENIFKFQKTDENNPAISIFNAEDKIAAEWYNKYKNETGRICIKFSTEDVPRDIRDCYKLPGRANLSNLAAALTIAKYFGVDDESIKKSLPEFKALPHRLELVDEINGVRWYNDSKATTPDGAITALDAFDQPIILIAGGYDKNLPFDEFGEKIAAKAKAAILIGQTASKIAEAIRYAQMSLQGVAATEQSEVDGPSTSLHSVAATHFQLVDSLPDAVKLANKLATSGDIVLLSPACASYDMFENYEQRGKEFIKLVRLLID
jgi:UDP-N-acetylmuramoylalanine--D-glutamate ligase